MTGSVNQTANNGKDPKTGRFLPGNKASPGRTPIAQGGKPNVATELRHIMESKGADVVNAMIDAAIAGDTTAGDKILSYIMPKLQAVAVQVDDKDSLPMMKIVEAMAKGVVTVEGETVDQDQAADQADSDSVQAPSVGGTMNSVDPHEPK
jgi:hypothetical protein